MIDNLTDKLINYLCNENVSRSELEIEFDKFFVHKFILMDLKKNDVEKYGPMFFFKLFHLTCKIIFGTYGNIGTLRF